MRYLFVIPILAFALGGCDNTSTFLVDRETLTEEQSSRRDQLLDQLLSASDVKGYENILPGKPALEIDELLSLAHKIRTGNDGRTWHVFYFGKSSEEGDSTLTIVVKDGYVDDVRHNVLLR